MTFEEIWHEADCIDEAIGGTDSISENEYEDYVLSCLINQFRSEDLNKLKEMVR